MPLPIPSYDDWMKLSDGGYFSTRNAYLDAVDKAVAAYHKGGKTNELRDNIRACLLSYISNYESRKAGGVDSWHKSTFNSRQGLRLLLESVTPPLPAVLPQVQEDPPPPPPAPAPVPILPVRPPNPFIAAVQNDLDILKQKHTPMSVGDMRNEKAMLLSAINNLALDMERLNRSMVLSIERCRNNYVRAMKTGYQTFENLHNKDADNIEFKLSLAMKVFEAMKALPPPLSALGTVGAGIAGQLKVERYSGHADGLELKVPEAQGMMKSIQDLAEKFDEAKTLNVAPSKMGNFGNFESQFERLFKNFEDKVDQAWKRQTEIIFDANARTKLASQLAQSTTKPFNGGQPTPGIINQRALGVVRDLNDRIRDMQTLFSPVTQLRDSVNKEQAAVWVCLQFICDYALSGLCGVSEKKSFREMKSSDLAAKNFGDPFIDFLDQHVGVIEKDKVGAEGKRKSKDIFASGKIPWQGHPTHKVALFMYLDWAQRNINPMKLITSSSNGDPSPDFLQQSQDYIKKLGPVIDQNAEGAFLGLGNRTVKGNVGDLGI
jgi:hypothetical protein